MPDLRLVGGAWSQGVHVLTTTYCVDDASAVLWEGEDDISDTGEGGGGLGSSHLGTTDSHVQLSADIHTQHL